MKTLLNYIGQLRLYFLADLMLLLSVIGSSRYEFIGAVFLHIAFLVYLENKHAHSYRAKVPIWVFYILAAAGLILYGHIEGLAYLLCCYLYTKKTKKTGIFGPVLRALQNFLIVGGIAGYKLQIAYIVGAIFFVRNLLGDFRDTGKDIKEGVKTIPVVVGFKKNIPYIHLLAMIVSSFTWWSLSSLSIWWLALVIIVEIATYNLTPRGN
jgi:1,4-dihydroxy-2-naphthoate octaprenyltransferase